MGLASWFTSPFRFVSGTWSDLRNAMTSGYDEQNYGDPYELNTNDDRDPMFREHFRHSGDMWAHHDPCARRKAEEKADYEVRNSSHLTGAKKVYANDVIGPCGPTIQLMSNEHYSFTPETKREYELKLHQWLNDTKLHRKLKTMLRTELSRGEAVGVFHPVLGEKSRRVFSNPVALNFRVLDARRLDDDRNLRRNRKQPRGFRDGIRTDQYGEPVEYRFDLRDLGSLRSENGAYTHEPTQNPRFDRYPAHRVVHLYHEDYPEQRRGFTQFAPSILPSVMARRAMWSVVKALRNMAQFFGFIEQPDLPTNAVDANGNKICNERAKPNSSFKIRDGLVKVLGGGMKFTANDQKLPSNGTESILTRMAAWSGLSICMPEFMISGDLSKTNFTSTRAGYQLWDGYRDEARDRVATDAYQKAVALFHGRAQQIPGFFSEELMEVLRGPDSDDHYPPTPRYKLHWKERPSISPLVEARAKQIELATGTKTHAQLSTESDVLTDWECEAELYGITLAEYRKLKLVANHSIKAEDLAALLNEDDTIMQEAESGQAS